MAGVLCVNPVFAAGNVDDEILPLPKALQDVLVDASAIANINSQDNKQNNKAQEEQVPQNPDNFNFDNTAQDGDFSLDDASTVLEDTTNTQLYRKVFTFDKLGAKKGLVINAGQKTAGIDFTLPVDKVVTSARLALVISQTEAMEGRTGHLEVKLNGEDLGSLPLVSVEPTDYELEIPGELLSQDNSISFEVEDDDEFVCMIEYNGKHAITIDAKSNLQVEGNTLELGEDLSLFPLPFLDTYDNAKSEITYVFSKNLAKEELRAASMLSSYLGIKAAHRGVKFNVAFDTMPQSHAIIFGRPGQIIAGMELPKNEGIYIKANPYQPLYKDLIIVAHDRKSFLNAVSTITSGKDVQGQYMGIHNTALRKSKAYDAPYWVNTSEKIFLKDLVNDPNALVSRGYWHDSIKIPFRAAPDLYQFYEGNSSLNIAYEFPFEKSLDEAKSGLTVALNGQFIDKLSVNKKGLLENVWRFFGGDAHQDHRNLMVTPNMIYGSNLLEMYFDLRLKPNAPCSVLQDKNIRSVIDEKSYLDLTQAKHFAKMPNLSFFAGAAFPFTRYADLNKTVIVLPKKPTNIEIATLFDFMARTGNTTGALVYNPIFYFESEVDQNKDKFEGKDVLVIATLNQGNLVKTILQDSAFDLSDTELTIYDYGLFSIKGGFFKGLERLLSGDTRDENVKANRYLRTQSAWRGYISTVSPFDNDQIAVLITATSDDELDRLADDISKESIQRAIKGDIALITGEDKVNSFSVGDSIYTGDVSTIFKILDYASRHVVWLCFIAFFILTLLSYITCKYLQARAQRRLDEGDGNI